jgi:hypothetical protein
MELSTLHQKSEDASAVVAGSHSVSNNADDNMLNM